MFWRIWGIAAFVAVSAGGWGQTLAHKNWQGSGLTVEMWWSRAVFCAAGSDLKKVVGEMDALERMGCDAVEVRPDGVGAVEAMGEVAEEAGRRRMRVVVELDGGEDAVVAGMGFWGARGVAGFSVNGDVSARMRQTAGGRVVMADGGGGQLRVRKIPEEDAGAVRGWLAGSARAGVLLDGGEGRLGYVRAAMLLAIGVAARVWVDEVLPIAGSGEVGREFSAEEMLLWVPRERVTGEGMAGWVGKLCELRRQSAALSVGMARLLDFDAFGVVGWVVSGRDGRGPVLVVCNLSGKAVKVPVAAALRTGGVRGSLGKTLIRSDGGVGGGVSQEGIEVGVGGVFMGEIR